MINLYRTLLWILKPMPNNPFLCALTYSVPLYVTVIKIIIIIGQNKYNILTSRFLTCFCTINITVWFLVYSFLWLYKVLILEYSCDRIIRCGFIIDQFQCGRFITPAGKCGGTDVHVIDHSLQKVRKSVNNAWEYRSPLRFKLPTLKHECVPSKD